MKVAILISGYLRTFKDNINNIKEKIINNFDNVDIYIHITKNEDKNDKYLNFNKELDESIIKDLNPISVIYEENVKLSSNSKENDVLNLWLKYYKLNNIKKINENKFGKYDLVIKYRPDMNIISDIIFDNISYDKISIPIDSKIDKSKLNNINDKFICDIFAYGNSDIMDSYFNIYNSLKHLISKYGVVNETLLYYYLIESNIDYRLIKIDYSIILSHCNIFAICGDSGSGKTTLGNILKEYFNNSFMLECDRYHKWEREDDMWKKFTHLNPSANYITKMSEDIFDLKIGKSIYHVDYDHTNGKFTDVMKIDSNDNIIVCGLHSLYNDNNIYNIKIFIDTEEELKNFWKIKRDVLKRGYSISEVLEKINSRKEDYSKYVEPQKKSSDIIIKFYSSDNINIINEHDLNKDINTSLLLMVNEKYSIDFLLTNLKNIGYNFTLNKNDNYLVIDFKKYQDLEIPLIKRYNNYYDIIIYFILNMKNF